MFDFFCINSKGWAFVHNAGIVDVMYEHDIEHIEGTKVMFELAHSSTKRTKEVFDQFAMPDEYAFATGEFLMSRSQAKRLVARFEHFQKVILDFQDVTSIGQGFADQIFRVYQNEHPNVQLFVINATEDIKDMITRTGHQIQQ